MKQDEEIWKDVVGYEGFYQVSDLGRVRSVERLVNAPNNRRCVRQSVVLRQTLSNSGYYFVGLSVNGKLKNPSVHRLIAIAFKPNPENKPDVNHIDGVKTNNLLSNLEWATKSENGIHAFRLGLSVPQKTNLGRFGGLAYRKRAVDVFDKEGVKIDYFTNVREGAKEYGVAETSVSNCLNGRAKTCGGVIWRYA